MPDQTSLDHHLSGRPNRNIVGFHQDDLGDWVADLECGHTQHVRHNPPWTVRPWVITPEGRAAHIGTPLPCSNCKREPDPQALE